MDGGSFLYKPYCAISETPALLVVVIPGFQRSKEVLTNIAIELSRRGMVAILIDPFKYGDLLATLAGRQVKYTG